MRGVRVEKSAAIRSEHLYYLLRSDWPHRNDLLHAFKRRRSDVRGKILDHPACHEHDTNHYGYRKQHIERSPHEIDPKIAERMNGCANKTSHDCHRDGNACRRRHEVMECETSHL